MIFNIETFFLAIIRQWFLSFLHITEFYFSHSRENYVYEEMSEKELIRNKLKRRGSKMALFLFFGTYLSDPSKDHPVPDT